MFYSRCCWPKAVTSQSTGSDRDSSSFHLPRSSASHPVLSASMSRLEEEAGREGTVKRIRSLNINPKLKPQLAFRISAVEYRRPHLSGCPNL